MLLVVGNLALAGLVVATHGAGWGWTRADHDVAYVLLSAAAAAAWPLLRRRRVTTLLLASLGAWSLLTGLFLVYVTPGLGHGRWMRWWHGVTSVGFCLAFLAHWSRNHPRLVDLARRLAHRRALLLGVLAAWALVGALAVASFRPPLRALFDDRLFLELTTLSFAAVAAAVASGAALATGRRARPRVDEARNPLRGAVDVGLLALTWLVALTGLPLLYFSRDLRAVDAYWLLAGWHVVTGALLAGLVALHAGFNARPLRAHAGTR